MQHAILTATEEIIRYVLDPQHIFSGMVLISDFNLTFYT